MDEPAPDIPEERPPIEWPLEPGRAIAIPVAMRDILPWTKPGCRTCDGRGVVTKTTNMTEVQDINGRKRVVNLPKSEYKRKTTLCECGIKRFRKVQKTHVQNGQLFAVEPWVAIHPETIEEAIAALEVEQSATQPEASPDAPTQTP